MERFNNFSVTSVPSTDTFLASVDPSYIGNRTVFCSIQAANTSATTDNTVTLICKVLDRGSIIKSEYVVAIKRVASLSSVELLDQKIVLRAGESLFVKTSAGSSVPVNITASVVEILPTDEIEDRDLFNPLDPDSRVIYHVSGEGTLNSSSIVDNSNLSVTSTQLDNGSSSFIYSNEMVLDTSFSTSLKCRGKYITPDFPNGAVSINKSYTIEFWCYNGHTSTGSSRHIFSFSQLTTGVGSSVPLFTLTAPRVLSTSPMTVSVNRYNNDENTSTHVLTKSLDASSWNHIVILVDRRSSMLSVFINGSREFYRSLYNGPLTHRAESESDIGFYFGGGFTSKNGAFSELIGMPNFFFSHIMISEGLKYPSTRNFDTFTETRRFSLPRFRD